MEQNGQKMDKLELHGTWDGQITADLPDGSHQQLWQKAPLPADPTRSVAVQSDSGGVICSPCLSSCCRSRFGPFISPFMQAMPQKQQTFLLTGPLGDGCARHDTMDGRACILQGGDLDACVQIGAIRGE